MGTTNRCRVELVGLDITEKQIAGMREHIARGGRLYKIEKAESPDIRPNSVFCRIYWTKDGEHFRAHVPIN